MCYLVICDCPRATNEALVDYQKSVTLAPDVQGAIAGLAITYHAMGNVDEALKLWEELIEKDQRYMDWEWLVEEHHWLPPLVDEARILIEKLSNPS